MASPGVLGSHQSDFATLGAGRAVYAAQGQEFGELGGSGTSIVTGVHAMRVLGKTDHNQTWDRDRYNQADRMRRSDATVYALLRGLTLPLLGAEWSWKPASDSPQDTAIAEEMEAEWGRMSHTWAYTLRQILLLLPYGSMPFEKVWEARSGGIHLRKLAPRHPSTILDWKLDEHGGFDGFVQQLVEASKYETITIEPEKAVVFVNQQELADFKGLSVLRPAFRAYSYKSVMLTIDALAKERHGGGLDVATLKDPTRKAEAEKALMTTRMGERNYMLEVEGVLENYRVLGLSGSSLDPLDTIRLLNLEMARSMGQEFIMMGEGSTGSFAQHQDKTSLLFLSLGELVKLIEQTLARHVIPQWVLCNHDTDVFPTYEAGPLDTRNLEEFGKLMQSLTTAGADGMRVLEIDDPLREYVRETLDLPEAAPVEPAADANLAQARDRRPLEQFVAFGEIEETLDAGRDAIAEVLREGQDQQIEALLDEAERVFDAGGDFEDLSDIQVEIPKSAEVGMARELRRVFRIGQRTVVEEAQRQGVDSATLMAFAPEPTRGVLLQVDEPLDPTDEGGIAEFFRERARSLRLLISAQALSAFKFEILPQAREGAFDRAGLRQFMQGLAATAALKAANRTVSEALNLGRTESATELEDEVRDAEFSAFLDGNTCGPCRSADETVVEFPSPEFVDLNPPLRSTQFGSCEGGSQCRCVFLFRFRS